jgi:hypothetical protein
VNKVTSHFAQTKDDLVVVGGSARTSRTKKEPLNCLRLAEDWIDACSKLGKDPTAFMSVGIRRCRWMMVPRYPTPSAEEFRSQSLPLLRYKSYQRHQTMFRL